MGSPILFGSGRLRPPFPQNCRGRRESIHDSPPARVKGRNVLKKTRDGKPVPYKLFLFQLFQNLVSSFRNIGTAKQIIHADAIKIG